MFSTDIGLNVSEAFPDTENNDESYETSLLELSIYITCAVNSWLNKKDRMKSENFIFIRSV
ncbi:hypothetical protein DCPSUM001_18650 [Dysgonomonas capnocytophagoides]|nr:hypothetical protein DCPSUM001_18650 [Dysgonomonas capnocytophagoides]